MSDRLEGSPAFATTRWSLVLSLRDAHTEEGRAALHRLCEIYWYPLYAYARRSGLDEHTAQDRTQGFWTHLLAKPTLLPDPDRGRFRTYLLGAFRHFLSDVRAHEGALKRGGQAAHLRIDFHQAEDRYAAEPADGETPETSYVRAWARALLDDTWTALATRYEKDSKQELFEALSANVFGGAGGSTTGHDESYGAIANRLGLSEGAVKVAAHRLRQRYRELLLARIRDTVATPEEAEDELRELFRAF